MNKKRIIILSVAAVLTVALGCWVKSRMGAWFHNPVEPSYEALSAPSRILLTFGEGEKSRIVSWQYDSIPSVGWVELVANDDTIRVEASSRQVVSQGGKSVYYQAHLKDLSWNTGYQYRINHHSAKSDFFRFSMPDSLNREFSYIFIGDVQDTINGIFPEIMQNISQKNSDVQFYLFGGDLIERPHDRYWNEFFKSVDSVAQTTPIVAVAGNHEYIKGISGYPEERFALVFPYFQDKKAGENLVFTFNHKEAQFFLLDSNKGIFNLLKQKKWLSRELEQSTARWKIVALHHPVYSIRGKSRNLFVRWLFKPVINKYGVDLVLQGHEHGYARMSDGGNPAPLYIISHNSNKTYKHKLSNKVIKYDNKSRYYQRIDVGADTLKLSVFDVEGDVVDRVDIVLR